MRSTGGGEGSAQLFIKFDAVKLFDIFKCEGAWRRIVPVAASLICFFLDPLVQKRVECIVEPGHCGEEIQSCARFVLEDVFPAEKKY